jgi:hypothetical protein
MATKPTRFILLFEGRTGSSYIMNALDSLPYVKSCGELLVRKTADEQERILRDLYETAGVESIGLKTKLRDIADTDRFVRLMAEYDVKMLVMYRKNLVKLALSRLNAKRIFQAYGTWNLAKGQNPLPAFAPTPAEFDEALNFRKTKEDELKAFVSSMNYPHIVRYYEDLLDDKPQLFADMFKYFKITPDPLYSEVKKNTSDDMRDTLLNFDDIKAHYQGTPYEEMFD